MSKITTTLASALTLSCISGAALAETGLDVTSGTTERRSITQMAVECDGQPRGPCFMDLLKALEKINVDYDRRYMKGLSGTSPAYQPRYQEMQAAKRKELNGIGRAEMLRRAAALN